MAHYIYVIEQEGTGYVKIGITKDVKSRLKALQTSSPQRLRVVDTLEVESAAAAAQMERAFHKFFARRHVLNEWFEVPADMVLAVLVPGMTAREYWGLIDVDMQAEPAPDRLDRLNERIFNLTMSMIDHQSGWFKENWTRYILAVILGLSAWLYILT